MDAKLIRVVVAIVMAMLLLTVGPLFSFDCPGLDTRQVMVSAAAGSIREAGGVDNIFRLVWLTQRNALRSYNFMVTKKR